MMEAVKRGGDRQKIHELIRKYSMMEIEKMKNGEECNLLERLANEPEFGLTKEEIEGILEPALYIGRCEKQVEAFLGNLDLKTSL